MKRLALCVLCVVLAASATAQDKKISELTSGSPAQATDMLPIARSGANFRLAASDFLWSPVGAVTTTRQLTADESGTIITNAGDTDGATVTLPAAQAGLCFDFTVAAAATLTITAGSGDTIRVRHNVTAAAGSITSNVIGEGIRLCAVDADQWIAVIHTGTVFGKKVISAGDDAVVPIFSVTLPTADTGCAVHTSFTYIVTNGTDTQSHAGIFIWAFVNDDGTVTGEGADSGEVFIGIGCGASCESVSVTVVSTTATANVRFNNTLSATGSFTFAVLNDSCGTITVQ